jgi:hypothetical protein
MAIRNSNHVPFYKRPKPAYLIWERGEPKRGVEAKTLNDYDGYRALHTWQDKRCAMCGRDGEKTVLDHCHETGLARGFLCSSCNTKELTQGNNIEWKIYKSFPPAKLLGLSFYYNDFGQAPYPIEHPFSKDEISAGIEAWDDAFCYKIIKDFCSYDINLEWIDLSELRSLIRKSFVHIRTASSIDDIPEYEEEKTAEEEAYAFDQDRKDFTNESENIHRLNIYFSVPEDVRDVVDKFTIAVVESSGQKIGPQDVLHALMESDIAIQEIPSNHNPQ